jgi:hypothetical protein
MKKEKKRGGENFHAKLNMTGLKLRITCHIELDPELNKATIKNSLGTFLRSFMCTEY